MCPELVSLAAPSSKASSQLQAPGTCPCPPPGAEASLQLLPVLQLGSAAVLLHFQRLFITYAPAATLPWASSHTCRQFCASAVSISLPNRVGGIVLLGLTLLLSGEMHPLQRGACPSALTVFLVCRVGREGKRKERGDAEGTEFKNMQEAMARNRSACRGVQQGQNQVKEWRMLLADVWNKGFPSTEMLVFQSFSVLNLTCTTFYWNWLAFLIIFSLS